VFIEPPDAERWQRPPWFGLIQHLALHGLAGARPVRTRVRAADKQWLFAPRVNSVYRDASASRYYEFTMGRNPIDWRHGAMTPAERQARRRERLRHNIDVHGLVEHVARVLKQATATERDWLLDQLASLIKRHQDDRKRMNQAFQRRLLAKRGLD
jgi:hypothetical protein